MKKVALAAKVLLTIFMLMAVGRYVFMYNFTADEFIRLSYPSYLILPLGLAKLLGLIMLWKPFNHELTVAAYSGFFFNFLLATGARAAQGDLKLIASLLMIILLSIVYKNYMDHRVV